MSRGAPAAAPALAPGPEAIAPAAAAPPEQRGLERDGVRLMVARGGTGEIRHSTFARIGDELSPGDVLVINVSATVPAAVDGSDERGQLVRLHFSSPVAGALWTVEPRRPLDVGSQAWRDHGGGLVELPSGATVHLLARDSRSPRLWLGEVRGIDDLLAYLTCHGQPVRYSHTADAWPLADYQSVYAFEPGSSEMPSAGRPFTERLMVELVARGVVFAPIVLHGGLASFEEGETPDAERYRVPETTAQLINHAREAGRRAIAVGTTCVRAIETVTDARGVVHPGSGVTDLLITRERGVRGVDGIVTGWHDAGAPHLELVSAVAGAELIERCYGEARSAGYLWHEFGDSLLALRG